MSSVTMAGNSADRAPMREDFVRQLNWLLEERGMSHRELAEQLGRKTHTPYYRWAEGKAEPSPEEVFAMERILTVPPGTLSRHLNYLPIDARSSVATLVSFEDAIRSDPNLNELGRRTLRAVYAELTRKPVKRPLK